jgi:hypothetical protein
MESQQKTPDKSRVNSDKIKRPQRDLNLIKDNFENKRKQHNLNTCSEHNDALSNACEEEPTSPKDESITTSEHSINVVLHGKNANSMHSNRYIISTDLQLVAEAWEKLPEAIRTGIVAMVKAAKEK